MNTINEFCKLILESGHLIDKITPPANDLIDVIDFGLESIEKPNRDPRIDFSEKKCKVPRLEHLNQSTNRAICLHHFANHELMAIELFAYALLKFQNIPTSHRQKFFLSLLDEQKHFQLYLDRLHDLGMEFGDKPLNYIFWKFKTSMSTPEKFSAIMSISLEGANLDFALLYKNTFLEVDDEKSASIMDTIYKDEIKHVRRGLNFLRESKPAQLSDWDYYNQLIEFPFTPRRAKGYFYLPRTREQAGFDAEFVSKLGEYRDEFSNRKKEQIPERMKDWGVYSG